MDEVYAVRASGTDLAIYLPVVEETPPPNADLYPVEVNGLRSVPVTLAAEVPVEARPFLTTDFADYTVTEGLLLCIVLVLIFYKLISVVKGGFSWLR